MSAYKNFRQGVLPSDPIEQTRQEWEREHKAQLAEGEKTLTEEARRYNDQRCVTNPSMNRAEREAACIAFCRRTTVGGRASRDWAKKLRTNYQDGIVLQPTQIRMASEALREIWENGECKQKAEAA